MTTNIPTQLNNPGDLKNPATGKFQNFASPEEGFSALKSDLQAKISGKTKTGLNGNSSLLQFASVYAPSSDNNDPTSYAHNLAQKLGVDPNTPIGSLHSRLDDFASAIASNEGYQGPKVLGATTQTSAAQEILDPSSFAAKIKAKYPQYANLDDNTLTQKVLSKYPQYAGNVDTSSISPTTNTQQQPFVNNVQPNAQNQTNNGYVNSVDLPAATPQAPQNSLDSALKTAGDVSKGLLNLTGGNAIAENIGTLGGYGYEKLKGLLGGQDNSQYYDLNAPGVGTTALDAARTVGTAGLISGAGGLLSKLVGSGSYLGTDVAQGVLTNFAKGLGVDVADLTPEEVSQALGEAASNATSPLAQTILKGATSEAVKAGQIAQGVGSFSELHPAISGALSAVKKGATVAGLAGLGLDAKGLFSQLLNKLGQ